MNPHNLPEDVQKIYRDLAGKYSVAFEPLRLKDDICLNLLKVTDLEPLLDGKDPLKNVSDFPFWIKLWEAAIVLADFLVGQELRENCTLMDVGAGLGAPGLAAAAKGCAVTLTDYQDVIVDFQKVSAAASGLRNVDFKIVDWLNPPDLEPVDIIIGAEIVFNEKFNEPLLDVFRKYLKPGGVIYLAHDAERQSLAGFLQKAEEEYKISVSRRKLKSLEQDKIIILNRLIPRN